MANGDYVLSVPRDGNILVCDTKYMVVFTRSYGIITL